MFFIKFVPNCRVPTEKIMTSNVLGSPGHLGTHHTRTFKGKSSGQNIHAQTLQCNNQRLLRINGFSLNLCQIAVCLLKKL